jgi:ketosteroid isomerase-like protein
MKRTLLAVITIGVAFLPLTVDWVQAQAARTGEQEIQRLEEERRQAVLHNDVRTLERLYATGMTTIDILGLVHTSTTGQAATLNTPDTRITTKWVSDEMSIRIFGDSAVVTQRAQIADVLRGQTRDYVARLTHVWVRRDGRWQLVARHATRVGNP